MTRVPQPDPIKSAHPHRRSTVAIATTNHLALVLVLLSRLQNPESLDRINGAPYKQRRETRSQLKSSPASTGDVVCRLLRLYDVVVDAIEEQTAT